MRNSDLIHALQGLNVYQEAHTSTRVSLPGRDILLRVWHTWQALPFTPYLKNNSECSVYQIAWHCHKSIA